MLLTSDLHLYQRYVSWRVLNQVQLFVCGMINLALLCGDERYDILEIKELMLRIRRPLQGTGAQMEVLFIVPTSDLPTMFRLTATFWAKFWEDDTDPDLEAVRDSLAHLPEIPQFCPVITLEEVRSAVRSLNVCKARGPDMWSNGDIRNFTEDFLENLVHLLNSFSNTGRWPDSLLDATVALLQKPNGSVTVDQTRPITILSALYRLWSRIITRKFIQNAAPFLPLSVQGNRPGASSKWLAVFIQSQVEAALIKNTGLHVASLDLTKAFNLISRELLQVTSPRMGVPLRLFTSTWPSFAAFAGVSKSSVPFHQVTLPPRGSLKVVGSLSVV